MSAWGKLLEAVQDVAPTLAVAAGTAIGGPLAGGVAGALARKLTGSSTDDDIEVMAAEIMGDPEKLQAFRIEMRKLELEELRLRTLDVKSARTLAKYVKGSVWISIFVVAGFALAVFGVMTEEIPASSQAVAYLLLGTLATAFGAVLNFWLGSSQGSKEKTQILDKFASAAKQDQRARQ